VSESFICVIIENVLSDTGIQTDKGNGLTMNRIIKKADILLPAEGIDKTRWSVIACDQYTSEPEYWAEVEQIVGDAPSTLKITLPEVYLESEDVDIRIDRIHAAMKQYEEDNIFEQHRDTMIYVERRDSEGKLRPGIMACVDLEAYDYHHGSSSLIRTSEETVESRIPPRIKVREDAIVETPHIMLLLDDPEGKVIEPLAASRDRMKKAYDYDMMLGGGHNTGYFIDEENRERLLSALDVLQDRTHFEEKYGIKDVPILAYAVGDGNHSLATAKEYYESLKRKCPDMDLTDHPARYALVEIVNLHCPALEFEAIHRIVTEIDPQALKERMREELDLSDRETECGQSFAIMEGGEMTTYWIGRPSSKLTVGSIQNCLDRFLMETDGKIDYIHGTDTMMNLTEQENSLGIILPVLAKEDLFPTIILNGALPRKTFSMGHAQDKRYYMECRRIVPGE